MLNLDLRTAAIPAPEVENDRRVLGATRRELARQQEREASLVGRQEQLPPLADESAEIGEPEDVDVVHRLQGVVEQDERNAGVAGRPAKCEKVRERSDVRLRR